MTINITTTTLQDWANTYIDGYTDDKITNGDKAMMKVAFAAVIPAIGMQAGMMIAANMTEDQFAAYLEENVEAFKPAFNSSYCGQVDYASEKQEALCMFGAAIYAELLEGIYASINA